MIWKNNSWLIWIIPYVKIKGKRYWEVNKYASEFPLIGMILPCQITYFSCCYTTFYFRCSWSFIRIHHSYAIMKIIFVFIQNRINVDPSKLEKIRQSASLWFVIPLKPYWYFNKPNIWKLESLKIRKNYN